MEHLSKIIEKTEDDDLQNELLLIETAIKKEHLFLKRKRQFKEARHWKTSYEDEVEKRKKAEEEISNLKHKIELLNIKNFYLKKLIHSQGWSIGDKCTICQDDMDINTESIVMPYDCKHCFHLICMEQIPWSCPNCRSNVENVYPIF